MKGIQSIHAKKLRHQLTVLNALSQEEDILAFKEWSPHKLKGLNPKGQSVDGHWSLKVSGNWRITYFLTENGDVVLTDYLDYH